MVKMMNGAALVVFAALAVTTSSSLSQSTHRGSPINAACVAVHCAEISAACFADRMCSKNIGCVSECFSKWDQDKTPEKFTVQNCTGICVFSYTSEAYIKFMSCLSENQCFNLPTIPNTCKGPDNLTITKQVPLASLNGSWSVIRGYHPVYDCYPCQNDTIIPYNSTAWVYRPYYEVYLANGSLGFVKQSGFLNNGTNFKDGYPIFFEDAGVSNFEKWWVIDKADDNSYVLIYYCGSELQWNFEGAIVLAHDPKLTAAEEAAITASYKAVTGLDFSKFCSPSLTNCMH